MTGPGDRPPPHATRGPDEPGAGDAWARGARGPRSTWSLPVAIAVALLVGLLGAVAWGLLRAILDLGAGLVGVAALAGWGIGVAVRQSRSAPLLAAALAAGAWLSGLVLSWVVSMAILQGSSRTFIERLEGTPFTDWMSPQFGILEIAGLVVYVVAAAYGGRRRA